MNLNENIHRIKEMMGLITEGALTPNCNENGCSGTYTGPEFQNGSDVAHQYSNTMAKVVGDKLKELFKSGIYVKVDMDNIEMSTTSVHNKANPNPTVVKIKIPFIKVQNKCEAYTSFDHVGGWGHTPELEKRKQELSSLLIPGDNFDISNEKNSNSKSQNFPDGSLNEYWIQWRNKDLQGDCTEEVKPSNQIKIVGTDLNDFRNKIKNGTNNVSIDEDSLFFDPNNFTLSFRDGDTKIKNLSLIFDPDKQNLNSRLDSIKEKNPTLKVIKKGNLSEGSNLFYFALSIIY